MPRFFVDKNQINDDIIRITEGDSHHIARSLRMAEGDEVTVSDGSSVFRCSLAKIRDDECICEIIERIDKKFESPLDITLCMAYPKGDKLETVIQKAVELGASRIIPFESSRCIKRPKAEKQEKQLLRLLKIAEEAAKQCGRAKKPEVTPSMTYKEMLSYVTQADLALICYEAEDDRTIKNILKSHSEIKSVAVIVGSEGGFSKDEVALAEESGVIAVSLGNRILRCETAPAFVLSAISYEFEL